MNIKQRSHNSDFKRYIDLIEVSGAFDKKFYKAQLKKIGKNYTNPIEHYLLEGWKVGIEPHPCFNTAFYLQNNEDVQKRNIHPFLHFVMYGYKEDRLTRQGFSLTEYRKHHPDVSELELNPFSHFTKKYGQTDAFSSQMISITSEKNLNPHTAVNSEQLLKDALLLGLFDYKLYCKTYKKEFEDVASAFADYLEISRFSPVNPSAAFDSEIYHKVNSDVYLAQMSPLHHYLESGREEGRSFSQSTEKWRPSSTIDPQSYLLPQVTTMKIAICLHIFYEDYITRFAEALENFPTQVDVFITLTDSKHQERARVVFGNHRRVNAIEIRVVPNRGRNFGPLLVEFAHQLKKYDLFCHLHSKKSLYSGREQTQWADYLTQYLLKDTAVIIRLLNAFAENDKFGLYYPTTFWMMPSWVNHVTMNKGFMKTWSQELGLEESDEFLSYPAGGMFWARPEALQGLLDLNYSYESFPAEPLPNDGSMLHALERIIGTLAETNGYQQLFYYPATGQFTTDQSFITMNYHNTIENLLSTLRNYSHVSFDVFDTLVRREYTVGDYAKLILGQELTSRHLVDSPQNFVDLRNSVEFDLRKRANFQGDVRIDEIYTDIGILLDIDEAEAQRLMQREFELDLGMIIAKNEMVDIFNELGSHGHVLWVISDTYYTRGQIGLMLRKAGITAAYRLLVSSEERKRKDNSTMWHMVKSDLARDGVTSYIHVGDNVVADSQRPGDLGLNTFHILHPIDKWRALGFPRVLNGPLGLDEGHIRKWGKLVSCLGRVPFL